MSPKKEKQRKLSKRDISLNRLEHFKKEVLTDHHVISLAELVLRFQTNLEKGLTLDAAKHKLLQNGPNSLTPSRRTSKFTKFVQSLTHGFSLLLWVGVVLCILAYLIKVVTLDVVEDKDDLILAGVLVVVIFSTGIFMFFQEQKSSKV